jgi:hypothetical protein
MIAVTTAGAIRSSGAVARGSIGRNQDCKVNIPILS